MKLSKLFYKIAPCIVGIMFLVIANLINTRAEKPYILITKQESVFNVRSEFLNHFNLGLKRMIASSLWISTILDSDVEHYKKKDLNSWMFLRFYSISNLEPKFYENYVFGGPYLSIVKDDIEGASIIYNKGLVNYPNDFDLLKNAGFHFYFEANDVKAAYPIYLRLSKLKSGLPYIENTLTRMEAAQGNLNDALKILTDLQAKYTQDSMIGKKIFQNRYAIKAEIDLNCLNSQKINCDTKDLNGMNYIANNGEFRAQSQWVPYRPKWRSKKN